MLEKIVGAATFGTVFTAGYTYWQEKKSQSDLCSDTSMQEASQAIEHYGKYSVQGISTRMTVLAFRDMGWDGPIYVSTMGHFMGPHVVSALDKQNRNAAFVYIPEGGKIEVHYAIMGHEAAHCVRYHNLKSELFRGAGYSMSFILGKLAFDSLRTSSSATGILLALGSLCFFSGIKYANRLLTRHFEIEADCYSAEKLGNAHVHLYHLRSCHEFAKKHNPSSKENKQGFSNWVMSFFNTHPSDEERIAYLSKIAKKPLPYQFFESHETIDIMQHLTKTQ